MYCSECPFKDDNFVSDRILCTLALPSNLYDFLVFESQRLTRLGYRDKGMSVTVPSLILHYVASRCNSELYNSPINVAKEDIHEFDSLKLFNIDKDV